MKNFGAVGRENHTATPRAQATWPLGVYGRA